MKSLSFHQPYFFPYIGYYSLINSTDIHVFADSIQYERRGWVNRNRIISNFQEPQYIVVPVKHSPRETSINCIEIDYSQNWEKNIINRLQHYKKFAPYYKNVLEIFDNLFSKKYENLAELNIASYGLVSKRLQITTETFRLSELDIIHTEDMESDDWGRKVCERFSSVDCYRNAPMGKTFYNADKYKKSGVNIEFIKNKLDKYNQYTDEFIPALSIIDVMMFNAPERIREMLDDYELI